MQRVRTLISADRHRQRGVTLVEMLAAIALLAILASVAVPSFAAIARQYRLDATTEELMASVQFARVEALRHGHSVMLARRTTCERKLKATEDWSCGWQVFVDTDDDKVLDSSETVLQSVTVPAGVTLLKKGASLRYLHLDMFGQSFGGHRFEIFPQEAKVEDGQLVCFSTATRLRIVKRMKECPDLPDSKS